jgi:hypothetical protein
MKTRELIEALEKMIAEDPKIADGDVILNIAGYDDYIQRDLETVKVRTRYTRYVVLCA